MLNLHTLYTAGYTGLKPQDFQALTIHLNAIITDIRYAPFSRNPLWNKPEMATLLGDAYTHLPLLGNKNYKGQFGEGIHIADMNNGTVQLVKVLKIAPAIILCACPSHETCHRNTIAEEMLMRYPHITVQHLSQKDIYNMIHAPQPQQKSLF